MASPVAKSTRASWRYSAAAAWPFVGNRKAVDVHHKECAETSYTLLQVTCKSSRKQIVVASRMEADLLQKEVAQLTEPLRLAFHPCSAHLGSVCSSGPGQAHFISPFLFLGDLVIIHDRLRYRPKQLVMQVILASQTIRAGASQMGAKHLRSRGGAHVSFNCLQPDAISFDYLLVVGLAQTSSDITFFVRSYQDPAYMG